MPGSIIMAPKYRGPIPEVAAEMMKPASAQEMGMTVCQYLSRVRSALQDTRAQTIQANRYGGAVRSRVLLRSLPMLLTTVGNKLLMAIALAAPYATTTRIQFLGSLIRSLKPSKGGCLDPSVQSSSPAASFSIRHMARARS